MAHIRYESGVASIAHSDAGWYDVAAQVGKHANTAARRSDITAVVSKTCGHGAPACFIPSLAELHLNTSILPFGRPERVDLSDRLWRLEHAPAVGALFHEAAHAKHTRWDMDAFTDLGASKRMIDVIVTLEEPRIERNAVLAERDALPFIRSCAMDIVAKDFKVADTPYGASVAAGLLLARVDAGVLTKAEVAPIRTAVLDVLDADVLDVLEPLWQRFLRLYDTDYAGMVSVAREWLEALGMDPDAPEGEGEGEDDGADLGAGALFGEGDGDGEGDGEGEGRGCEGEGSSKPSMSERIAARGRKIASKVDESIAESRGEERAERRRAERKADAERAAESKAPHGKAFGGHGYGSGGGAHLSGTRKPTDDERRAARRLSRQLEDLHFHDRVVHKRTTAVPPGRLRGRAAVAQAAAISDGRNYDGDLWKGKVRRVVDATPLSVGLLVDISGSMGAAMGPLASTQWVLSTAGAHIDAKVSTVHFGEKVHGVLRSGTKEKDVRLFTARDGHEAFRDAALALDRELGLLDGRGARLLVVLSDGEFVSAPHREYAEKFIPLAIRKGVAVMFLDFTGYCSTTYGATKVNVMGLSPTEVAALVGKAAADEMRRVDAGR